MNRALNREWGGLVAAWAAFISLLVSISFARICAP